MTTAETVPPKVLYILGSSRSGSTIVDTTLGELEGFFSVGELRFVWQRLLEGRKCGCGAHLRDCEVWSAVFDDEAGRELTAERNLAQAVEWQRASVHLKYTWRLLRRGTDPGAGWEALTRTAELMDYLYRRVAAVTGAQVVIDSSKRPSNGAVVRMLDSVEPYFLHLVRDPRAVAYSQTRRKPNPDRDAQAEMPTLGTAESTFQWLAMNAGAAGLVRRHGRARSLVLRYEDFMAAPRASVQSVIDLVGERPSSLPFEDDRTVRLGVHHTVSGNPVRFDTGAVTLREDDRWRERLPFSKRALSAALALPLMLRYHYSILS